MNDFVDFGFNSSSRWVISSGWGCWGSNAKDKIVICKFFLISYNSVFMLIKDSQRWLKDWSYTNL
jgi:hypothetical protein